jgi:hypothetical protein
MQDLIAIFYDELIQSTLQMTQWNKLSDSYYLVYEHIDNLLEAKIRQFEAQYSIPLSDAERTCMLKVAKQTYLSQLIDCEGSIPQLRMPIAYCNKCAMKLYNTDTTSTCNTCKIKKEILL